MDILINDLALLARGDFTVFERVTAAVRSLLVKGDRLTLAALESKAFVQDKPEAIYALDDVLNLLCEANSSDTIKPQWHTMGVTLLVKGPALLQTLSGMQPPSYSVIDTEALRAELAALAGVSLECVKVDPRVVSAKIAYLESSVDCFQRALKTKIFVDSNVSAKQGPPIPFNATTSEWAWQELVVFVSVHGPQLKAQEALAAWEFHALNKHTLGVNLSTKVPLELIAVLDHVGGAWSVFSRSLHAGDAFSLRTAIKQTLHKHNLEAEDLQIAIACVEGEDENDLEYRVSVLQVATREVLSGLVFRTPFEPKLLIDRLEEVSVTLGCNTPYVSENKFFGIEVDDPSLGVPNFFTPGRLWRPAASGSSIN